MKIVDDKPPNYAAIALVFPLPFGTIFTYGDTCYNPDRVYMSPAIVAHERVHVKQQGKDPEGWWLKYLTDPQFRYEQELEAHRVEWATATRYVKDRNKQLELVRPIAARLASSMYGNLVTSNEARKAIMETEHVQRN